MSDFSNPVTPPMHAAGVAPESVQVDAPAEVPSPEPSPGLPSMADLDRLAAELDTIDRTLAELDAPAPVAAGTPTPTA